MTQEETPFLTIESFQKAIEAYASENRLSYMDAVIHYCDENFIDLEDLKGIVSPNLKDKLMEDAISNGFFAQRPTVL